MGSSTYFSDDWVVLAPTRWKLRAAVRRVNLCLAELRLEKHREKTFFGRIRRGFDFLGYRFSAAGLSLAAKTKQRFVDRATRLQEQGAGPSRIGQYVRHWLTWCRSGGLEHFWDAFVETVAGAMIIRITPLGGSFLKESCPLFWPPFLEVMTWLPLSVH